MAHELPEHDAVKTEPFWSQTPEQVLQGLESNLSIGLDHKQARHRHHQYGPNTMRVTKAKSPWLILLDQLKSIIVILLGAASIISFAFHEYWDAAAILVVIGLNTLIGFVLELKAAKSMHALRKLGTVMTKVRRDGRMTNLDAHELVPGDIVILEGGDVVTADLRLLEASRIEVDESMLTGESVPVTKSVDPIGADTVLADRVNMLFKGTAITRGSGMGVVVATGMNTEVGKISSMVEAAKDEATPLQRKLDQLGHKLVGATIVIAVVAGAMGFLAGRELFLMIETTVALAVAAIPEGLPVVATIALARGMRRMAKRNALVNQLAAVETLGSTTIICTDKTGTLTENRMTVTAYALASGDVTVKYRDKAADFVMNQANITTPQNGALQTALEIGVLCNNAALDDAHGVGDPMEVALLKVAAQAGLDPGAFKTQQPEVGEEAFDSDIKMMATYHQMGEQVRVVVKGAAEPVLKACTTMLADSGVRELSDDERARWLRKNEEMASNGLRVLALAEKRVEQVTAPYEQLTFVGLVALVDPPRPDVRPAVERCRTAGIKVVMVTGDQLPTAINIARQVAIVDELEDEMVLPAHHIKPPNEMTDSERQAILQTKVFARVSPAQKLELIDAHQQQGEIVAMTGDGVNDAPALKKADIGIAMGIRGTDVAKEASDLVLLDDAFPTIVEAVSFGRTIFTNIRNFVLYLMSCNVSEILIVGLGTAGSAPLPILPLQILFLNVVTDVFPALALGMGKGEEGAMSRPPYPPHEPILGRRQWFDVIMYSIFITISVLGGFAFSYGVWDVTQEQSVTMAFLSLAFAQLWHVFNMRTGQSKVFVNEVTRNPYVWGALGLCVLLLVGAVYLPVLSDVLGLTHPGLAGWLFALGVSVLPLVAGQIYKELRRGV